MDTKKSYEIEFQSIVLQMVEGNFVRHAVPSQGRRPEKGEMDWTLSPIPQFQLIVKLAVAKGDRGQVRTAKVVVTSQPVEDQECSTPHKMRGLLGGLFGKYKRLSFRDKKREGGEGGGMATDSGPPGTLPQTMDEPTIEQRPLETRPQKRLPRSSNPPTNWKTNSTCSKRDRECSEAETLPS
ncbi:hypothetical protein EYF80_062362 [Liparis tanakae]|uniref:Uncharacterized protein n=1 Tax=Liparis tanakae TaxID=230148 RepID=A0A4Z2EG94_9TELE|nr:hypothetical protein EYF80_062362 [Liparis tanakae]